MTRARRPRRPNKAALPDHAALVRARLAQMIPAPRCELVHENAWQLLVATILSAQSTDKMVNQITPELFRRWPTPAALAKAPTPALERTILRSGFFRSKAKSLKAAAKLVTEKFGGEVPRTMEEITLLPGVARKTGNVVLGTAYGIPTGITVDTHATRVSRLLGLTRQKEPPKIEQDLMKLVPQAEWIDFGHRLVLHGRYTCIARKPRCAACLLRDVCPSVDLAQLAAAAPSLESGR